MRNVSIIGLCHELVREELKMCLNREYHVKKLKESLDHTQLAERVKFVVLQMIPYIMHL